MYSIPRKPLHMQQGMEEMIVPATGGSPSWRNVDNTRTQYMIPDDRCNGNTPFRRYPDGKLDVAYVGFKVIDALNKLKDLGKVEYLDQGEAALISLIVPHLPVMDRAMADIVVHLAPEEVEAIRGWIVAKEMAIANYNAGRGAGHLPGDFMQVDKSNKGEKEEEDMETRRPDMIKKSFCNVKMAAGDLVVDPLWSDRFKGTPLYDEAKKVEAESLKHEIEQAAKRIEQYKEKSKEEDGWRKQDALYSKRNLLESKLKLIELQGGKVEERDAKEVKNLLGKSLDDMDTLLKGMK